MNDDLTPALSELDQAAIRMSEQVREAIANGYAGFWMAFRLSDGGSDEVIYEHRKDAIAHQLHEQQCCYVKIPWDNMPVKAAHSMLRTYRALYQAGFRFCDPDDERQLIVTGEGRRTPRPRHPFGNGHRRR